MGAALRTPLALLLALVTSVLIGAVLIGGGTTEPTLLAGLAAVAVAVALGAVHRAPPAAAHTGAVAVRARRRRLDQGAPPRQHDPDAAGHTRSRAPSRATATA
jgi:hypothetical protein